MKKVLKGFKDYADYLSYADVCLAWMNADEHKKTYDTLLKQQDSVDPVTAMRRMGAEAHAKLAVEVTA
jgi:hypothetical protein